MASPKISVVTITTRPGVFRFTKETLQAQTFRGFEWVVVDGKYDWRKDEVAKYMKYWEFPFTHVPDPPRTRAYGLAAADNEGIRRARGELVVWLQDFILIPKDGLQKFWDLYQESPDSLYTGVDGRFSLITHGEIDREDKLDILKGWGWEFGRTDYLNERAKQGTEVYQSVTPYDFELNWAAFDKNVAYDIGGFNEEYDDGFAFDNTEFAFRAMQLGKKLLVDPTNYADAINHWELFPRNDDPYIPGREAAVKRNGERYNAYVDLVKKGLAPIVLPYL